MENLTTEMNLWFLILESIFIFLSYSRKLSSKISTFFTFHSNSIQRKVENRTETKTEHQTTRISTEDLEKVMKSLGFSSHDNELMKKKTWKKEEICALFVDQEPSLDEVNEAFCVFDENGDGYVDAEELQRVICKLGFGGERRFELDSCKKMIALHDKDGDGLIGFDDFVELIECSF